MKAAFSVERSLRGWLDQQFNSPAAPAWAARLRQAVADVSWKRELRALEMELLEPRGQQQDEERLVHRGRTL